MIKLLMACAICLLSGTANAASLKQAFSEGKFAGQLRIYNNTLALQHGPDKYGTAFGGRLGFESKAEHLWGFSAGVGYYTANDLETNKDDVNARAPFTPTNDVDLLGEAFLRWKSEDWMLTAGRQLINTPFANPSDAFVIPVTYTGYSMVNSSIEGLKINLHYLTRVKERQAQDFADTGTYITTRYGVAAEETEGTAIAGLNYSRENFDLSGWHYTFSDMFNLEWLETSYKMNLDGYNPYVSAHYGMETETGDEILGKVDSKVMGIKLGVMGWGGDFSLAYEDVSAGRFLAPYTFFTDAFYTNSMITGLTNIDEGQAWKLTAAYNFNPQLWGKLSYSLLDFESGTDTAEIDGDVKYAFKDDFDGLSVWLRVGYRDGDTPPAPLADLIEYRTQLQYVF